MSDRELLELAAKAVGIEIDKSEFNGGGTGNTGFDIMGNAVIDWHNGETWNPLADDGDAFRLAVNLGLSITPYPIYNQERHSVIVKQRRQSDTLREANPTEVAEVFDGDPYAATRRAIVLSAAACNKE